MRACVRACVRKHLASFLRKDARKNAQMADKCKLFFILFNKINTFSTAIIIINGHNNDFKCLFDYLKNVHVLQILCR